MSTPNQISVPRIYLCQSAVVPEGSLLTVGTADGSVALPSGADVGGLVGLAFRDGQGVNSGIAVAVDGIFAGIAGSAITRSDYVGSFGSNGRLKKVQNGSAAIGIALDSANAGDRFAVQIDPIVTSATSSIVNTNSPISGDGSAGSPVTILSGAITDASIAPANKDGAAGTASMRTLGTLATQAAAGNDTRLSDQRVPTSGSVTNAKLATGAVATSGVISGDGTSGLPVTAATATAVALGATSSAGSGNNISLANHVHAYPPMLMHGDGSDGDVTISSNTTLTRDMTYNTLIVNSGVTLSPDGYRVHARVSITINGSIVRKGSDASGATGGGAPSGASRPLGTGAAGGNGTTTTGSAGSNITRGVEGVGGSGGAGTSGAGGAAGTVTALAAQNGSSRAGFSALFGICMTNDGTGTSTINCGSGGGGGGGSTTNSGGGGGGGGGVILLSSPSITVAVGGEIQARGGNGAAGTSTDCGGGGGGAGGRVYLNGVLTNNGTINAAGGVGGASGGGSGVAGSAGTNGTVVLNGMVQ